MTKGWSCCFLVKLTEAQAHCGSILAPLGSQAAVLSRLCLSTDDFRTLIRVQSGGHLVDSLLGGCLMCYLDSTKVPLEDSCCRSTLLEKAPVSSMANPWSIISQLFHYSQDATSPALLRGSTTVDGRGEPSLKGRSQLPSRAHHTKSLGAVGQLGSVLCISLLQPWCRWREVSRRYFPIVPSASVSCAALGKAPGLSEYLSPPVRWA